MVVLVVWAVSVAVMESVPRVAVWAVMVVPRGPVVVVRRGSRGRRGLVMVRPVVLVALVVTVAVPAMAAPGVRR